MFLPVPGRTRINTAVVVINLINTEKPNAHFRGRPHLYLGWELEEKKPSAISKTIYCGPGDTEKEDLWLFTTGGNNWLDSIALDCKLPIYKVFFNAFEYGKLKGVVRPLSGQVVRSHLRFDRLMVSKTNMLL